MLKWLQNCPNLKATIDKKLKQFRKVDKNKSNIKFFDFASLK